MNLRRWVAVALGVVTLGYAAPAYACGGVTITGTFADGCRDFSARSTKDIAAVDLYYADGRVVTRWIGKRTFTVDGAAGGELARAVVRSGGTSKTFTCDLGSPPVAALEIRMSPNCQPYTSGSGDPFYWCLDGATNPQRTVYTDPGDLRIDMGCNPPAPECLTVTFRATGSTDPDGDLAGWSIAFGDGAVASGSWATTPPDGVSHEYADLSCPTASGYCAITLTVTDAGGRSDTDTIQLAFFDATPD